MAIFMTSHVKNLILTIYPYRPINKSENLFTFAYLMLGSFGVYNTIYICDIIWNGISTS